MEEMETTLEEAARLLAVAQREFDDALAERNRLREPFDAAVMRLQKAREKRERIEQGMDAVKRAHAIRVALGEAGIEYAAPLVVAQATYSGANLHYLSAVGSCGTGLYIFKPKRSHRYHGTQHVILIEHANAVGVVDRQTVGKPSGLEEAGAWLWEQRGSSSFGAGTGAVKPLAPPEGGRWRWLKVREQETLTMGGGR